MIDFDKIKQSLVLPLILGIAVLVLFYALSLGLGYVLVAFPSVANDRILVMLVFMLSLAIRLSLYVIFFPLFLWAGYRAAKKYGANWFEAGLMTAVLAILLPSTEFLLLLLFSLISSTLLITNTPPASVSSIALFAGMLIGTSAMIEAAFCVLKLFFGIGINFAIGAAAAYFATSSIASEEVTVVEMEEKFITQKRAKKKLNKKTSGRK